MRSNISHHTYHGRLNVPWAAEGGGVGIGDIRDRKGTGGSYGSNFQLTILKKQERRTYFGQLLRDTDNCWGRKSVQPVGRSALTTYLKDPGAKSSLVLSRPWTSPKKP
jgi:hypothetical protein